MGRILKALGTTAGLGAAAIVPWLAACPAVAQLPTLDPADLAKQEPGRIEHCTEEVKSREFGDIFDCGDELFDTPFTARDGVGGDVGNGQRFTRVPRYDLAGYTIQPVPRVGGPEAQSCSECHRGAAIGDAGDGAGGASLNAIEDKLGRAGGGRPENLVVRNPPHLFGPGGQQVLAEEMTAELQTARMQAIQQACSQMKPVDAPLLAKGVGFGMIRVMPVAANCAAMAQVDTSAVQGIDRDLVVRSFGLEGTTASLRSFILSAFHNELGMVPVEFSGMNSDNDRDGVQNEILVDDATAMTLYLAAQPIPLTKLRLDDLRLHLARSPAGMMLATKLPELPVLSMAEREQIGRGEAAFTQIGCARCHVPQFTLQGRLFREPSPLPGFRQPGNRSPSGLDLVASGVDPGKPQMFDLTEDQPDNQIELGDQVMALGSLEMNDKKQPVIRLFSDLKRHDMGPENAEEMTRLSEIGQPIPGSVFMTAELWGVGGTAPYLHDGSATTLDEAVVLGHGGEAAAERAAFRALPKERHDDLIAFLDNLVLAFLTDELDADEEDGPGASTAPQN